MTALQFGIDLGGTKTELIVLDEQGQTLRRQRMPTPAADYDAIISTIELLVRQAEQSLQTRASALGVGAPGTPYGEQGLIKNANTTCLIGRALAQDLTLRLGIPVIVENDANCLVLSEATDGAGAGADCVFGVILGTGVGGGLVVRGHLVNGPNRITGEWGHNPLPIRKGYSPLHRPSRLCYCGLPDCVETYLCGRGLLDTHRDIGNEQTEPRSADELAQWAARGDASCQAALNQYFMDLSLALSSVINTVDPDVVVFGGGLSKLAGLCDETARHLETFVFSNEVRTQFRVANHGDSSGVRGAAWLTQHIIKTGH